MERRNPKCEKQIRAKIDSESFRQLCIFVSELAASADKAGLEEEAKCLEMLMFKFWQIKFEGPLLFQEPANVCITMNQSEIIPVFKPLLTLAIRMISGE